MKNLGISYEHHFDPKDGIYHCELNSTGHDHGCKWYPHPDFCLPGLHKRGYLKEMSGKEDMFLDGRYPATIDISGFGFHGMVVKDYWGWNSEHSLHSGF